MNPFLQHLSDGSKMLASLDQNASILQDLEALTAIAQGADLSLADLGGTDHPLWQDLHISESDLPWTLQAAEQKSHLPHWQGGPPEYANAWEELRMAWQSSSDEAAVIRGRLRILLENWYKQTAHLQAESLLGERAEEWMKLPQPDVSPSQLLSQGNFEEFARRLGASS